MVENSIKKRVLVVEDDPAVANLIHQVLKEAGYTVDLAIGGEKASENLRESSYDLMILDLMMPRISGWDILEGISKGTIVPAKRPRILILSAVKRSMSKEELKERYSVCDYLEKPFMIDELLNAVHKIVFKNNNGKVPSK